MTLVTNLHFFRLGLVGFPLGHSHSPRLHAVALRAAGLQGAYELYPVPVGNDGEAKLRGLLEDLRAGRLDGLNVTIPYKQAVMAYVDDLSPVARAAGAVNTLLARQGRLFGENTDVPGFLVDLERLWKPAPGRALVLGAGGSARAVTYALASTGWQVRVMARRLEQAKALVNDLHTEPLDAGGLSLAELRGQQPDLIVNTTPSGMFPDTGGCPWPQELPLPPGAAVYDLVYNPIETLLVRRARAQGLAAATGMGMLAAQAALAFALWTDTEAPYKAMRCAAGMDTHDAKLLGDGGA